MSPGPAEAPGIFGFVPKVIKEWTTFAAIGTFLLYLLGYLSLRFHLTAMGVATDLSALDERYLFAGAKFLVFVGSCLPLLGLEIGVCWTAGIVFWKLLPQAWKARIREGQENPYLLAAGGVAIALVMVQWVMRACFAIVDIPFLSALPGPAWCDAVLLDQGILKTWYFTGLLLATAIVVTLLAGALRSRPRNRPGKALVGWLAVLAAIMVLLLPVNFGTLILPYSVDRTTAIGKAPVSPGEKAWLLWDGKDWMTYLVKSDSGVSVVATPLRIVERLEVHGSDSLLDIVFARSPIGGTGSGAVPQK